MARYSDPVMEIDFLRASLHNFYIPVASLLSNAETFGTATYVGSHEFSLTSKKEARNL
jgi:hypothetical protein